MREGARASRLSETTPGPQHTPMVGSLLCVQVPPHPFSWPLCGWERARLPETHPSLLGWGHLFTRKPPFRNTPGSNEVVRGYVSDTPISPTPQRRRELIPVLLSHLCAQHPRCLTHPPRHYSQQVTVLVCSLQPSAPCSQSRTTPLKNKCWCMCVFMCTCIQCAGRKVVGRISHTSPCPQP